MSSRIIPYEFRYHLESIYPIRSSPDLKDKDPSTNYPSRITILKKNSRAQKGRKSCSVVIPNPFKRTNLRLEIHECLTSRLCYIWSVTPKLLESLIEFLGSKINSKAVLSPSKSHFTDIIRDRLLKKSYIPHIYSKEIGKMCIAKSFLSTIRQANGSKIRPHW